MRDLTITDLRALNESVLVLNSETSEASFAEKLSAALATLISFDLAAVECFDSSGAWANHLLGDPEGIIERYFPAFLRLSTTHPLFPAFLAGQMHQEAIRISDVMSRKRLYNLELFNEFLKPIGTDTQLGISLALADGSNDVLILSRNGTDFSLREKQRLNAFLPHIASARRHDSRFAKMQIRYGGQVADKNNKYAFVARLQRDFGLTCREGEVVWWLTKGKTDKDIANVCGISQRTVQKHCEGIYRKWGVDGRTSAVILALRGTS